MLRGLSPSGDRSRFRALDALILALAALAVALVSMSVYRSPSGELRAVVTGRDGEWIYPLDTEVHLEVAGPLGATHVVIGGGGARVESSPCGNQTCVATGEIRRAGQWAACLPNEVFLRIEGAGDDGGVDAGVY